MFVVWGIVGFFFTSLMFYLNHRFVGHGPLGKWPPLEAHEKTTYETPQA